MLTSIKHLDQCLPYIQEILDMYFLNEKWNSEVILGKSFWVVVLLLLFQSDRFIFDSV